MEAIKKKMAFLKIEKDNAIDRADSAEAALREAEFKVTKVRERERRKLGLMMIKIKHFIGSRGNSNTGKKISTNSARAARSHGNIGQN